MIMKSSHSLDCHRCKILDQFYQDFNSDSKRNVSYFGIISYLHYYEQGYLKSFCLVKLANELAFRGVTKQQECANDRNEQRPSCFEDSNRRRFSKSDYSLKEDTNNIISVKKPKSNSSSSPGDNVFSKTLKTNEEYNITKRSPSKVKNGPNPGTLKRKRWNLEKLESKKTYEDDLFEEQKFKPLQVDESNSDKEDEATPRWSVAISPREPSQSPCYEDCYSPTELQNIRKEAAHYQFRRSKRKCIRSCSSKERYGSAIKMKEDPETYKTLKEVRNKLKKLGKKDCESDEDHYFTDGEDSNI